MARSGQVGRELSGLDYLPVVFWDGSGGQDRILLCSPTGLVTCYIVQTGLEFMAVWSSCLLALEVLGLQ